MHLGAWYRHAYKPAKRCSMASFCSPTIRDHHCYWVFLHRVAIHQEFVSVRAMSHLNELQRRIDLHIIPAVTICQRPILVSIALGFRDSNTLDKKGYSFGARFPIHTQLQGTSGCTCHQGSTRVRDGLLGRNKGQQGSARVSKGRQGSARVCKTVGLGWVRLVDYPCTDYSPCNPLP